MPSLSAFGTIPFVQDRQHRPFLIFLAISNVLFVLFLNFGDINVGNRTLADKRELKFKSNLAALRQRHEEVLNDLHQQPSRLLKKNYEAEYDERRRRINHNLSLSKGRDEARKILADPFYHDWHKVYDFATDHQARPVMYTFYEPAGSRVPNSQDLDALAVWKFAWTKAGWNPRVLNLSHAKKHQDYPWAIENLYDVIPLDDQYNRLCFLRHFAMAAMGGGWMSDFDTIPSAMEGNEYGKVLPNQGNFTLYELSTPSLTVGSAGEWNRVAKQLVVEAANAKKQAKPGNHFFFSDKMSFQKLLEQKLIHTNEERIVYENPELPITEKTCETSLGKALHFSHESAGTLSRAMVMLETMDQMAKQCGAFDSNVGNIGVLGEDTFYLSPSPEMEEALNMGRIISISRHMRAVPVHYPKNMFSISDKN